MIPRGLFDKTKRTVGDGPFNPDIWKALTLSEQRQLLHQNIKYYQSEQAIGALLHIAFRSKPKRHPADALESFFEDKSCFQDVSLSAFLELNKYIDLIAEDQNKVRIVKAIVRNSFHAVYNAKFNLHLANEQEEKVADVPEIYLQANDIVDTVSQGLNSFYETTGAVISSLSDAFSSTSSDSPHAYVIQVPKKTLKSDSDAAYQNEEKQANDSDGDEFEIYPIKLKGKNYGSVDDTSSFYSRKNAAAIKEKQIPKTKGLKLIATEDTAKPWYSVISFSIM